MIILGLDIATNTGWAVRKDGFLVDKGLIPKRIVELSYTVVDDYHYVDDADHTSGAIVELINKHKPDFIYIEQTNQGRNRTSQKQLEFLHYSALKGIDRCGLSECVRYVDSSAWRKHLKVKLSPEDRKHNKLVKGKLARGKITLKHKAVQWANDLYNLNLLLKDDDIADALALVTYGMHKENKKNPVITESDIEELFGKS